MDDIERAIWQQFNIKRGDNLPYTPFNNSTGRVGLVHLLGQLGYTRGAEVGVSRGAYSLTLCETIVGLHLSCVDPWAAYGGWSQENMDNRAEDARSLLAGYDVEFIRKPSLEAVHQFAAASLDFVYIDGAHDFDNVMQDIILWSTRVRKGGIVAGHDYYHFHNAGVVRAVDAYTLAHNITPWYVTKEDMPTFFWVRR